MVMKMTLQDYINKYGEESGTKRYNGVQKMLKSRKKRYDSQPYVRFTKDWFLWRYLEDGLDRFNDHVTKSKQSEENMIKRHGEELGKQKWQETVKKKNTIAIIRERDGEGAANEIIKKATATRAKNQLLLTADEIAARKKVRTEKSIATKKKRYGDKTKLEIYLEKYGEEGHEKYAEYLQKIFKSIGSSKPAELLIKSIIDNNKWLLNYTLYYRDSEDLTKVEWFLSSKHGVNFYDFCVRETKTILEYDGARWHPTKEQAKKYKSELMEVTKISYAEKYKKDQAKIKMAEDRGFTVFTVRSDFTEEQKSAIIEQFISHIKEKSNGLSSNTKKIYEH